jgi:D-3-phosphoglycerate dehydrogenase
MKMKKSSFLVNTARGKIVDERALFEALSTQEIAGAGIDVLESEPLTKNNILLSLENIIITPHIAWYSEESFKKIMVQGFDEVIRVLNGFRPWFIVNPEVFGKNPMSISH